MDIPDDIDTVQPRAGLWIRTEYATLIRHLKSPQEVSLALPFARRRDATYLLELLPNIQDEDCKNNKSNVRLCAAQQQNIGDDEQQVAQYYSCPRYYPIHGLPYKGSGTHSSHAD